MKKITAPIIIAMNLYNRALDMIDICPEPVTDEFRMEEITAEILLEQVNMLRASADMMEAAAMIRTIVTMPERCPNCNYNLLRHSQEED